MKHLIDELYVPVNKELLAKQVEKYRAEKSAPCLEDLRKIFASIDMTTLDVRDTDEKIEKMCRQVNRLPEVYPDAGTVAGICVYPVFIPVVKKNLQRKDVSIVSVAAGFPAAQTFREVKLQEIEMALEQGAQEIDVVISVGKILSGKTGDAYEEIREMREVIGGKGHLKVILESGVLGDPALVQRAALAAMAGGADFIKTSTGKIQPAARPEDVLVMAETARRFYEATGKKTGIKPAGGIAVPAEAFLYLQIVRDILGEEWTGPNLFRIGASRLANNTLESIQEKITGRKQEVNYF